MSNGVRRLTRLTKMRQRGSMMRLKKLKFVSSMKKYLPLMLLMASAIALASCQTTKIPNVTFYAEIPFLDCPEGVYVESLTKKTGFISCHDWALKRPFMVMLDPDGKKQVFGQWSEACRWAGSKKCNVELNSVKETVEKLDSVARTVIGVAK